MTIAIDARVTDAVRLNLVAVAMLLLLVDALSASLFC
jgi:hypothetical protein